MIEWQLRHLGLKKPALIFMYCVFLCTTRIYLHLFCQLDSFIHHFINRKNPSTILVSTSSFFTLIFLSLPFLSSFKFSPGTRVPWPFASLLELLSICMLLTCSVSCWIFRSLCRKIDVVSWLQTWKTTTSAARPRSSEWNSTGRSHRSEVPPLIVV